MPDVLKDIRAFVGPLVKGRFPKTQRKPEELLNGGVVMGCPWRHPWSTQPSEGDSVEEMGTSTPTQDDRAPTRPNGIGQCLEWYADILRAFIAEEQNAEKEPSLVQDTLEV